MELAEIASVDELFTSHNVADISNSASLLRSQALTTERKVRHLIGNKYGELLANAHSVGQIGEVVRQQHSQLQHLLQVDNFRNWGKLEANFERLSPKFDGSGLAADQLLSLISSKLMRLGISIEQSKRKFTGRSEVYKRSTSLPVTTGSVDNDAVVIAQGLYVLKNLGLESANKDTCSKSDQHTINSSQRRRYLRLKDQFECILRNRLFTSFTGVDPNATFGFMAAHMILKEISMEQLCINVLDSRMGVLKLENADLTRGCLISQSTVAIFKACLKEGQLLRWVQAVSEKTPLTTDLPSLKLDTLANFLPAQVQQLTSIPSACREHASSTNEMVTSCSTKLQAFLEQAKEWLTATTETVLGQVSSITVLLDLYKQIYAATHTTVELREWFSAKFHIEFVKRLHNVIREAVFSIASATTALNEDLESEIIPSWELDLVDFTKPDILSSLQELAQGSRNVKRVSTTCNAWVSRMQEIQQCLRAFGDLRIRASIDDLEDLDEEVWFVDMSKRLEQSHAELFTSFKENLADAIAESLQELKDIVQSNSDNKLHLVSCISAIIQIEQSITNVRAEIAPKYQTLSHEVSVMAFTMYGELATKELTVDSAIYGLAEDIKDASRPETNVGVQGDGTNGPSDEMAPSSSEHESPVNKQEQLSGEKHPVANDEPESANNQDKDKNQEQDQNKDKDNEEEGQTNDSKDDDGEVVEKQEANESSTSSDIDTPSYGLLGLLHRVTGDICRELGCSLEYQQGADIVREKLFDRLNGELDRVELQCSREPEQLAFDKLFVQQLLSTSIPAGINSSVTNAVQRMHIFFAPFSTFTR